MISYWPFQGGSSFVEHLCYSNLLLGMLSRLFAADSIPDICPLSYFVVTWMERVGLLALVCDVYCDFVNFSFGIMGQVWNLIVSIPDPCCLSYFETLFSSFLSDRLKQVLAFNKPNRTEWKLTFMHSLKMTSLYFDNKWIDEILLMQNVWNYLIVFVKKHRFILALWHLPAMWSVKELWQIPFCFVLC